MKYRSVLALIATVFLFVASNAISAQTATNPSQQGSVAPQQRGRFPRRQLGSGRPKLNLTDDQKAKLKSAHQSVRQQIEAVRNDTSLSQADKQAQVRAIQQSSRQQLLATLTPEQQQSLQSGRRGRRALAHHRLGELGLTADQKSQVQTLRGNSRNQIEAISNDASLSAEQKRDQIRSIMQSSRQQMLTILTPEQQQRLREHHPGGPGRVGPRSRRFQPGNPTPNAPGFEQ